MTQDILDVAERIRDEIPNLGRLIERAQSAWQQARRTSDELYADSAAPNLHGVYVGLERLFELIAKVVDGAIPRGEAWHQVLLEQMSGDIPGARPAVISVPNCVALDEYRRFRHLVRHAYPFTFDLGKLGALVDNAPALFAQVRDDLLAFAAFLEYHAQASP